MSVALPLTLALLAVTGCAERSAHTFREMAMGTECALTIHATDPEQARSAARLAMDRIHQLDHDLSDWLPDGELASLQGRAGVPRKLSPDLCAALRTGLQVNRESDGLFDPALRPLVVVWREARRTGVFPTAGQLEAARRESGCRHLQLDSSACQITIDSEIVPIDLGAIGKGFAAEEAYRLLQAGGHPDSLVAVGGDIRCGTPPPGRSGWEVTIDDGLLPPIRVTLSEVAISTSGDREQSAFVQGRPVGHIIDPRTGNPLNRPTAVTVIAADGATADAWASALCVAGPEYARTLAPNCIRWRVTAVQGADRVTATSPEFPAWINHD